MKKQILSIALSATMTASVMPTMMSTTALAEETASVTFEENLYYNDFETSMDGLEVILNSKNNAYRLEEGKLLVEQNAAAFQSDVRFYLTGSEDWEEYSLETTAQITGKPGYMYFAPKYNKESGSDNGISYQYMVNTSGAVRNKTNNGDIPSWGTTPVMKIKIDVDKTQTAYYCYPYAFYESSSYLDKYYESSCEGLSGGMSFNACWGNASTYVDEIKVIDLRAKAALVSDGTNIKPGDAVTVKFSESMNTSTLVADNFYLTDGTNNFEITDIDVNGEDEVSVTIPETIEDGGKYILVAKKEIQDANGDRLNNDKKFNITIVNEVQGNSEFLYYNDFETSMDGLEVILNSKNNEYRIEEGKLFVEQNAAAFQSDVRFYLTGSEDWEEYSLETTAQITGKPGYMYFAPKYNKETGNDNGISYQYMINTSGAVRNKTNNGDNASWGTTPVMKIKIDVDKTQTAYYCYPYAFYETSSYLDKYYESSCEGLSGGMSFNACWGNAPTYIDEIKVIDLRAGAKAYNTSDVLPGDKIKIKFTENMTASTLVAENVVLRNGDSEIPITEVSNNGTNEMYVTVPEEVLSNEEYTLVIKKEIKDANGDRLNNDKLFNVTTKKSNFNVVSVSPQNGATDVDLLSDITIGFDNAIDYENSNINVKITDSDNNNIAYKINLAQSTETTMYINLQEELEPSTTYNVEISDIKSVEGDKMIGTKKISFTTKAAGASFLYVNDFSDSSTLTDFMVEKKSGIETAEITDGYLKLDSNNTTGGADGNNSVMLKLNGSENWSDYEIEMDIKTTTQYTFPQLNVRNGGATVSFERPYNGIKVHTPSESVFLGEEARTAFSSQWNKLIFLVRGTSFVVTFNGEKISEGELSSEVATKGAISIGNIYIGNILIDSIKVKDLGISAVVANPKNFCEGDEVIVTFDREMNTDTFIKENVSVKAEDGNLLNISVRTVDSKTMAVKLPYGLASAEKFVLTLSMDITSKTGICLSSDKSFDIKSMEKDLHVGDLKLISDNEEINGLKANATINAQAYIKNSSTSTQTAVLVMAVYDASGKCVSVKTKDVTLESKKEQTVSTEGYTLPENIKGYTVKIMSVDTLENIKPLVTGRTY